MESTTTIVVFWMHRAAPPSRSVMLISNILGLQMNISVNTCDTLVTFVGVIKLRITIANSSGSESHADMLYKWQFVARFSSSWKRDQLSGKMKMNTWSNLIDLKWGHNAMNARRGINDNGNNKKIKRRSPLLFFWATRGWRRAAEEVNVESARSSTGRRDWACESPWWSSPSETASGGSAIARTWWGRCGRWGLWAGGRGGAGWATGATGRPAPPGVGPGRAGAGPWWGGGRGSSPTRAPWTPRTGSWRTATTCPSHGMDTWRGEKGSQR